MAANGGSDTVDIAASGFEELPADWQVENLIAAEQVVGHIEAAEAKGEPLDDGFVERTAALLHAHWVARHGDNAPVALRADFADLPSEEQDKDRVQVRLALQLRAETR